MKQLVLLVAVVAVLVGKDTSPSIKLTDKGCEVAYRNLCKFYEGKKKKDKTFREDFNRRKKFYNTHCIVRGK